MSNLKDFLDKAAPSPGANKPAPKTEEQTVALITRVRRPVRAQLKRIANDHDTNVRALIVEGINMVFAKYGKDTIA